MSEHSVSIPPMIEGSVTEAAEEAGKTVSEWLAEVAQEKLKELERIRREKAEEEARHANALRAAEELVAESEAKYGPIPEEYWREAEELVASLLAGSPTTLTERIES